MFSIFSTQGTLFRGALEDLRRVSRTLATQPASAVNPLTAHMDDVDAQPFKRLLHASPEPEPDPTAAKGASGDGARRPIVGPNAGPNAYRQIQEPKAERQPLRTVAQVMHSPAISVRGDQTLEAAWEILQTRQLGQAPVLDAQGRLVGLLLRAQLMRLDRLPAPGQSSLVWRAWLQQPVQSVMASPVPAVFPATQLRRVAQVLVDSGLPGLPVVSESDELVGFVSRTDVLRAIVHDPPLDLWT